MIPEHVDKKLKMFRKETSGFRKDSLTDLEDSSLISLRVQITGEASEKRKQWLQGKCQLTVDGKDVVFLHQKIKLDQNGHGSITL